MNSSIPASIATFAETAQHYFSRDPRFLGLAVAGSWLQGGMDDYSDLDLVIAVRDESFTEVMAERVKIAESLGSLVASFVGHHVGEPRLLICLYDEPLLHVDLKFVAKADFGPGVERPHILWERSSTLSKTLETSEQQWPVMPLQWFEDRFWIWVHYAAARLGRGELFEVIDMLTFTRAQVLGPLIARLTGTLPRGVRRLEQVAPNYIPALRATLAEHTSSSCAKALQVTVDLYQTLRDEAAKHETLYRSKAEQPSKAYLEIIVASLEKKK